MDAQLLELSDGRELAWAETGLPDGAPVFAFHGTPGSRHQVLIDPAPVVAAGVRMIVPDRPGYGASTFHKGRSLRDWAGDVARLADHLGVQRFGVIGISGGGPHAAACARFLPDRITAAALLSGVGPLAERGSEAGMMPPNRLFARIARRLPSANALPFGLMCVVGRRAPERVLAVALQQMPAADAKALEQPDVRDSFVATLRHSSRTAGRAAAQDFGLIARDWGFRLSDIEVPVHVWQGDADVNVPLAHAQRQAAAIPGAVLRVIEGEGHLMSATHMEEILRELLGAAR